MLWLGLLTTGLLVLAVAGLLGHLSRPLGWLAARYERVHDRWRPSPRPDTPSVEQIARDLRRLADLLERTASTDEPAKMARLTAAALAYDYVLLTACRTLEVPQPTQLPLDPLARLETEAALARRGLDW